MAVRSFDGASNIVVAGTGTAICNGAWSLVTIVKPTSLTTGECFIAFQNGTTSLLSCLADRGSGGLTCYTDGPTSDSTLTGVTAGDWQILADTKAAGSNGVRFHRKVLGSGSWTHDTGGTAIGNNATVCDRIELGSFLNGGFSSYKDMRLAVAAAFATELSDANIESIQTTPSTQKLVDLGAVAVWDLNQASTATAVNDLVGSSDQVAITGTSVVTGDDPPGWTFGATGGGGGGGSQDIFVRVSGAWVAVNQQTRVSGAWV